MSQGHERQFGLMPWTVVIGAKRTLSTLASNGSVVNAPIQTKGIRGFSDRLTGASTDSLPA